MPKYKKWGVLKSGVSPNFSLPSGRYVSHLYLALVSQLQELTLENPIKPLCKPKFLRYYNSLVGDRDTGIKMIEIKIGIVTNLFPRYFVWIFSCQ